MDQRIAWAFSVSSPPPPSWGLGCGSRRHDERNRIPRHPPLRHWRPPPEANPTSDDSAPTVHDVLTGEEGACLAGKWQPSTFSAFIAATDRWYNGAAPQSPTPNPALPSFLAHRPFPLTKMTAHASTTSLLSNTRSQTLLYDAAADGFRSKETVMDSFKAITQVASRESSTLRSLEGDAR